MASKAQDVRVTTWLDNWGGEPPQEREAVEEAAYSHYFKFIENYEDIPTI